MPVKIHGKDYVTVAERLQMFHEKFKDKKKSIRIIIHGCGTGEEALSMALTIFDFIIIIFFILF